jgi:AcrR family transcriptional regulator
VLTSRATQGNRSVFRDNLKTAVFNFWKTDRYTGDTMKDKHTDPAPSGSTARERILSVAGSLFYCEGIHATGVERIAEEAHASKRTMYQHFPSKTQLVEDYLRRIHDTGGMPNEKALDAVGASPRNRLLAIFDGPPTDRFRGCPFHNAAVEAADHMPGVHAVVHEHKLQFISRLTEVAAEAGAKDPYQLGHQLAVVFEGATALATSLNDTAPLLHARSAAEVLIDAAVRRRAPSR